MKQNSLIVVYSHSGNTLKLAKQIREKTGAVLCEITPEEPYPTAYNTVVEQAKKEIRAGHRPALKAISEGVAAYDTIFVGTPNWWSTIAPPVATFLESQDLSGKQIIPFCTHGGGGFGHIERDVAKLCAHSTVLSGLAVYGGSGSDAPVSAWLKKIGMDVK